MSTREPVLASVPRQLTDAPHGHLLTNWGTWSADGRWLVYDVRSDPAGNVFDGDRIERVHVVTGEVQRLYTARHGAACGVVTCCPVDDRIVFILGPEHPTPDWSYAAWHRQGIVLHADAPAMPSNLDARDLTPPFTPGALRGGTHVHTFSADGQWVAFTYEDHTLEALGDVGSHELNQRNVGISVPAGPVTVSRDHSRNHDGAHFSVLVTRTEDQPQPGTDQISRACEDAWVGTRGYLRPDRTRQLRAIAFQGQVVTLNGHPISEVFLVDLPIDVARAGTRPLEGTMTTRPAPPAGVIQRRLTRTANRRYPGIQGPRHWLRSSPDGSRIGFLMKDDRGVVQLWTVSPNGGEPVQLTTNDRDIGSAFTWSPDGQWITYVMDRSIYVTEAAAGVSVRLTPPTEPENAPRPEACVFSPDGTQIAYVQPVTDCGQTWNQIFVLTLPGGLR